MTDLLTYLAEQEAPMVADLRMLAEIESPTEDKAAVDRMGRQVAAWMAELGGAVETIAASSLGQPAGDMVLGRWGASLPGDPILLLCHLDTVWPVGTLAGMPVQLENGRLYGPGTYDMKAGIVIVATALRALGVLGLPLAAPVCWLCTADEETGSYASRAKIEELAARSQLVLVLEPAMPGGALKTGRKGVGEYQIRVHGRAAHAGTDHAKGINAIAEMAYQVLVVQSLTDYRRGTTVNAGVIRGGSASNVVPASCELDVDFRITQLSEAVRIDHAMHALRPQTSGASLEVSGSLNRPPMERNAQMLATFEAARQIASRYGLELSEGQTGGASDANFTAGMGVPTLDGLGADGDGGHATHEHVLTASLPQRALLLAALLSQWAGA